VEVQPRAGSRWLAPALIVFLSLVLRVGVIVADNGYFPLQDAYDYHRHGLSIAAGDGYPSSGYTLDRGPTALRPPAYPYLLGAVYALSGYSIEAARLVGAALGSLSVFLLFAIVRRIWGRRTALVAAFLAAVFPSLVLLSRDLLSEQLFIALQLGAVLCVLRFRGSGSRLGWAFAAGALTGLAALTRNPGPALLIPIVIGVWTLRPPWRGRALLAPLAVLATTVAVIAPWTLRNEAEFGRLIPITSSNGFALTGTYNRVSYEDPKYAAAWRTPTILPEFTALYDTPGVDEGTLDAELRSHALTFAWDHPAYVAEATAVNLLRLFEIAEDSVVGAGDVPVTQRGIGSADPLSERIGLAVAIVLAVVGTVAIARTRLPRGPLFLWLVPILAILASAPIAGLPRYRVPADPFILILAAIGALFLHDGLRTPLRQR
jgi:4-amino-4-deoxy-L-arabinose transferase-like glycosyltransferase